jgi:hypothetical protein
MADDDHRAAQMQTAAPTNDRHSRGGSGVVAGLRLSDSGVTVGSARALTRGRRSPVTGRRRRQSGLGRYCSHTRQIARPDCPRTCLLAETSRLRETPLAPAARQ